MTTPTEQNFNSFKGITGIHTNTANVVRDYVNMIPLGDTVVTTHGFSFASAFGLPTQLETVTERWPSGRSTGDTEYGIGSESRLVAHAYFKEDNTDYALFFLIDPASVWNETIYSLAFVVTDLSEKTACVSYVELPNDDSGELMSGYITAISNKPQFIRNTYVGTVSTQETYIAFAGFIFQISREARVRLLPNPFISDAVTDFFTQGGSASAETAAKQYTYLPQWLSWAHPSMSQTDLDTLHESQRTFAKQMVELDYDLAFVGNRLLFLDRKNNRIHYTCVDPSYYFRVAAGVDEDTYYDAGTADWFDTTNGICYLFGGGYGGSFTNEQTSDVMKFLTVQGSNVIVTCSRTTLILSNTTDTSLPFQWATGGVLSIGSQIRPLSFAGDVYFFGTDGANIPTLVKIDSSGSFSAIMSTDVSRRIDPSSVNSVWLFKNHGMHHVMCACGDDDDNGYAYCIDNGLWWHFDHTDDSLNSYHVTGTPAGRTIEVDALLYFNRPLFNETLTTTYPYAFVESATYTQYFIGPNFRTSFSGAIERVLDTTTYASTVRNVTESSSAATRMRMIPPLMTVTEQPATNYDAIYSKTYTTYQLRELNQTFSKRAILTKVGVRLDTGRTCVDRAGIIDGFGGLGWPFDYMNPWVLNEPDALPTETINLSVSYDRGQSFNTPKSRNLATSSSNRNDREICWCGLGSGNSMTLCIDYSSKKPTQIYAIDYSLV